eukprot:SAG22_NODE_225_length_14728_cov_58.742361_7_plen_112_part_00
MEEKARLEAELEAERLELEEALREERAAAAAALAEERAQLEASLAAEQAALEGELETGRRRLRAHLPDTAERADLAEDLDRLQRAIIKMLWKSFDADGVRAFDATESPPTA